MWKKEGKIFSEHHSQLPVVDALDNSYKIYYSTRDELGRSIPMCVQFSKDLKNYDPPIRLNLELGNIGSFDWSGIMPTEILTLPSGIKYLYYIGWSRRIDVPYHNNLGLAISNDGGSTWKKFSNGPVFHTSYKEPGYIGTVGILIEKDIWRMWYLSCREWINYENTIEPIYDIKYATSKNGIDWEPTNKICIPLLNDEGGISSARVIKNKESEYLMWFSVRDKTDYRNNPDKSYRIEGAFSKNGEDWTRTGVEIEKSIDISWDDMMVAYPYVIIEENRKIIIYNGNGFGKTGIGYAVST